MFNGLKRGIVICACAALAVSCMDYGPIEKEDFEIDNAGSGDEVTGKGLFITNEGNFMYGNASLSYYDPEKKHVENEVFARANAIKLGDVAQSMVIRNGIGWIVVNNSGVIYAIDINTFKEVGRITGFTSPRYIHFLSDEKAYVTQIWDPRIYIVNPKTYQITGYVETDMDFETGSTEQMVQYDKYVFTNCWSYQNRILVIDTETDKVCDQITVGIQPTSLVMDKYNKIWTVTDGGYEGSPYGHEAPSLYCIDAATRKIEKQFKFKFGDWPSEVQLNGTRDTIYFINKAERFDGDVSLATLPAIKDFGEFLPALKAISGDLSIDDLSSLEGVLDLSGCTFSPNSTLDLRLVAATRLTELRGGDFGGSLRIDASSLTPQPEAMPFEITGFKSLDTLRIAGFTHISALSLPTESCDDLTIENCGSQAPFTLSLPNLVEVRGTLLCRNCGKAGEANSASFPRLRNIGRQLSFYVGASSFTALEFPLLETIGNGEPVSDDPADDYALYTMPSGCAGEFILPSLQRVNGSMLVSTWNTSTDRAVAFRFPSLQSVAGEISVGHTAYKNRSVATLDFSALTAAGAIRIGNLSSVTDFSTFTQVLPRLSEQTWSVTDCGYNPTYQQMLDGETGAESK